MSGSSKTAAAAPIFERMTVLADPTRARLLALLDDCELTVGELCEVLRLPQSTVSRHLRVLADGGWVGSRRDGTRRCYRLDEAMLDRHSAELWRVTRDELALTPTARQDRRRLAPVVAKRRTRSREFFASTAGRWDRVRDELFGDGFYLNALPALLPASWTVGDLGCGTGPVSQALAPFVRRVVAVDESPEMLTAARDRLAAFDNVDLHQGDLAALPMPTASLDAATLVLVLHHLPEPAEVLAEIHRVLRPGGRLLVVDMLPHEHERYRAEMGHVWLGFSERRVQALGREAGFEPGPAAPLPVDAEADGPALFAAVLERPTNDTNPPS